MYVVVYIAGRLMRIDHESLCCVQWHVDTDVSAAMAQSAEDDVVLRERDNDVCKRHVGC
jgi:hypothetical protein